jgi:uncharacterized caspase-like protein
VSTGRKLCEQIFLEDEILTVTPEGLFDGPASATEKVAYRIGDGLNVVPVNRFYQDFYYPGLYEAILRGERPMPTRSLRDELPPTVTFVSPSQGGVVEGAELLVEVEGRDLGGGVQKLKLTNNGRTVPPDGPETKTESGVRQKFRVELVEGENRLRAEAQSLANVGGEPADLLITSRRQLVAPDLYIVAVGVGSYQDAGMNLAYPPDDARALAEALKRRSQGLYKNVHQEILVNEQATSSEIKAALTRVAAQAHAQDTVVVTFAGHGETIGQVYYFLPHEFLPQPGEEHLACVERLGIRSYQISDWLRQIKSQKVTLVFDTCNSGLTTELAAFRSRAGTGFAKSIETLSRAEGIHVIAAGPADKDTYEVKELSHGMLTYALLAGLGEISHGPLAGKRGSVLEGESTMSVKHWLLFAEEKMPLLTEQYLKTRQYSKAGNNGEDYPIAAFGE